MNCFCNSHTCCNKVPDIVQNTDSICYAYGYDRQRILMEQHVGTNARTKQYWGTCELVTETNGNTTTSFWRTFISGPYGVFAVVETRNGMDETHYILKDNLGSWTTVTDDNGTVEQRLSYDAWGNLRDPLTWADYTSDNTFNGPMFDRGFTGHEHLADFGLINMNGRVYDPVMSSFLSVDQYVQSPENAQGFNRYAYCMNNPLRFIDPTGWLPGDGGSGGSLPHIIIGGQTNYILPEVTIIADNPSLSNTYESFEYTPNMGGGYNPWSNGDNGQSNGHGYGGGGSGSGNHGGNQNTDLAAGVLTAMWGVSVAEPTPAGEIVSGIATLAATVYYGEGLIAKMNKEIAHLLTRPDGPDGFVYELRAKTSGYYPCVRTSTLVYMETGEVWKIGETTQINGGRYTSVWLESIGAGGVEQIPVFYGNQREIKLYEKEMLFGYYIKNGHLPPGNKIFR